MPDEWSKVRIKCRRVGPENLPDPPEVPVHTFSSPRETEREAKRIIRDFFPDGPQAAKASRDAYQAWARENAAKFFDQKTAKSVAVQRWEIFERAWGKFCIAEQDRGVEHAAFDPKDFRFSGRERQR